MDKRRLWEGFERVIGTRRRIDTAMSILPTTINSLLYKFCSGKRKFVLAQLPRLPCLMEYIYITIIAGQNRQVNRGPRNHDVAIVWAPPKSNCSPRRRDCLPLLDVSQSPIWRHAIESEAPKQELRPHLQACLERGISQVQVQQHTVPLWLTTAWTGSCQCWGSLPNPV